MRKMFIDVPIYGIRIYDTARKQLTYVDAIDSNGDVIHSYSKAVMQNRLVYAKSQFEQGGRVVEVDVIETIRLEGYVGGD